MQGLPLTRFLRRLASIGCLCLLALPAQAQLLGGLPEVRLPPASPLVERLGEPARALQARLDPEVRRLLQRYPQRVALDPAGAAILRSEVIAIDPGNNALLLARAAGFETGAERRLEGLDLRIVVLRAPHGMDTAEALARLRKLDPDGSYDFNHLYFESASAPVADDTPVESPPRTIAPLRIGLVDSGVDAAHPALAATEVHAWGCQGHPVAGAHGTAVASLLAAATVYSADVYCGEAAGGSATAFAAALAWMARERVPVVNISLVGPDNLLLRRATQSLASRGHILVAAVGNDGPAAAPLFPAAYPGVIGVTGVDPRDHALPEALRGPQVDFAARGSGLRAADERGGWHKVRGTSFAAPTVARAAAELLQAPDVGAAARVRGQLAADAIDLGSRGRDDTYGDGLLR